MEGAYYLGKTISGLAAPIGIGAFAIAVLAFAGFVIRRHEAELKQTAEQALPGLLRPHRAIDVSF